MRLAVCTLSAVLLSGCSWLGYGGGQVGTSQTFGAGAGCGQAGAYGGQYAYGAQYNQHSQASYAGGAYGNAGCGGGNAYAANGYGAMQGGVMSGGAMQGGYGMQTAQTAQVNMGLRGTQNVAGYGDAAGGGSQFINGRWVASTQNAGNILGNAAPYGAAVGGQYANMNAQWSAGTSTNYGGNYGGGYNASGNVKTVQGRPIYVPQPYPAYYGVGVTGGNCGNVSYACGGLRGGYTALPFGIEVGIGTDISVGGDIVGDKPGGPAHGGAPGVTLNTSGSSAISYGDAYKNAVHYDLGLTYDLNPSTTVLGRLGYSEAEGNRIRTGTIDDSLFVPAPAVVTSEDLYAQWSDLEQWTVEGGVRKYIGGWNNTMSGIRPYVQGTAGFTHNSAISLSQDSDTLMPAGSNVQPYAEAGWTPTASGAIGAEMQVGPRTAIGVEAGVRWRDDLNTIAKSDDRWSVPVRLRGRVSF